MLIAIADVSGKGVPAALLMSNVQASLRALAGPDKGREFPVTHGTAGVGFVGTRDGRVLVLRPGETVWIPAGEEHWHGATSDTLMGHLAMLVTPDEGEATPWLEPVTEEQYQAAHAALG